MEDEMNWNKPKLKRKIHYRVFKAKLQTTTLNKAFFFNLLTIYIYILYY